jgi:phosphate-selective porin
MALLALVAWAAVPEAFAADPPAAGDAPPSDSARVEEVLLVGHTDRGFVLRTQDDSFAMEIQARGQFRYAAPWEPTPRTIADLNQPARNDLLLNRARLKIGGHAYRKWLTYFYEYELSNRNLLDFRVQVSPSQLFNVRVGQFKMQYNRERVTSSGRQQMSEVSLINAYFTLDRQQGLDLYGRWAGGGVKDLSYWATVASGTGQQLKANDDSHPMFMGRAQWNPFGRVLPFEGSDTRHSTKPVAAIAVAAATNRSPFTTFSQTGGGALRGFPVGAAGQYRVNQWVEETAFMYRGFSWQQELHWKEVRDQVNGSLTRLLGTYVQAGYFPHGLVAAVPRNLEVALRYAHYDPNSVRSHDVLSETSLTFNWFIQGHNNKVTADVSHYRFEEPPDASDDGTRFRLQWDISL